MSNRYLKTLFWYIFVASRGGATRARIMRELLNNPSNANKLAERLGLDYTTVRHHIEVLQSNGLIISHGSKYNVVYFPSQLFEENVDVFEELCGKVNVGYAKQRNKGRER